MLDKLNRQNDNSNYNTSLVKLLLIVTLTPISKPNLYPNYKSDPHPCG